MKESEDYILTKKMVREKYHNRCYRCGIEQDDRYFLNVVHIKPKNQGGTDELKNLVLSCSSCKKYVSLILDTSFHNIEQKDLQAMEIYCVSKHKKTKFIHPYSTLTLSDVDFLRQLRKKTSLTLVMECIESLNSTGSAKYFKIEHICPTCNNTWFETVSKTALSNIINKESDIECEQCEFKKRQAANEQYEYNKTHQDEIKMENAKTFILQYLAPERQWNEGIKTKDKITILRRDYYNCNEKLIISYIQNINYQSFLRTPYWRAIAEYKKYIEHFKCELCNGSEGLNVHHKTYENHGDELNNLNDLTVLCGKCHKKFHNITEVA